MLAVAFDTNLRKAVHEAKYVAPSTKKSKNNRQSLFINTNQMDECYTWSGGLYQILMDGGDAFERGGVCTFERLNV